MTTNVQTTRMAAIVHGDAFAGADALLAAFAQSLQQCGWRVGGVVHERRTNAQGRKGMFLTDITTGREFCISQDLGPQSHACCIDPAGVAQASAVLRQALADGVDLAIVNRFGALEAQGGGFAAEMLALAQADIPCVTVVAEKHFDAWQAFTGGMAVRLPAHLQALCDWSAPWAPRSAAQETA